MVTYLNRKSQLVLFHLLRILGARLACEGRESSVAKRYTNPASPPIIVTVFYYKLLFTIVNGLI